MIVNQDALDFLVFSQFSFSLDNLKNQEGNAITRRIIERAYRDASSHVLSILPKQEKNKEEKAAIAALHSSAVDLILSGLNRLCSPENEFPYAYDIWHDAVCLNLNRLYQDFISYTGLRWGTNSNGTELRFSYGIAQKWINMTMKYMVVTTDLCAMLGGDWSASAFYRQYGGAITARRQSFHAPVDRYIINAAWAQSEKIALPLKENADRSRSYKTPAEYVKPWSRWERGEYKAFRKSLAEQLPDGKTPLDWEARAWIDKAGDT